MAMKRGKKKSKSKFKERVAGNSHKQKNQGAQYGHLTLPKGVNIFKEEAGSRVKLDFIPYEVTDPNHPDMEFIGGVGELWYKRPFKIHRNIGANNDVVVCPTSFGKKCPICEYRARRLKEGADKQETDALKTSLRNLYVVVPKDNKDYEEKPHIWDISQYLFQNMLNEEIDEDEDYAVFPDLEEGLTLRIRFGEAQIGRNKFAETSRIDFDERDEQYGEDYLKKVPNLDEVLTVFSYTELEKKFMELEDEEPPEEEVVEEQAEEEEEEEKPRKKKEKPKSKKKKEPELPEDWDDIEAMDEDMLMEVADYLEIDYDPDAMDDAEELRDMIAEDQDIEKPKPKKKEKSKPKKKKEPEPEEDEDEDEEEKPKSKKKSDKKSSKKDKCPHGHKFGKDCEEFEECEECDLYEDCLEAYENG